MAVLTRINVTPLKGTALHHPESTTLTARGIEGDRRFFLIDASGELLSAHDHGPLIQVHASYQADRSELELSFPDGTNVAGSTSGGGLPTTTDFHGRDVAGSVVAGPFAAALSDYIGQDVRLVRAEHEGDGPDVYPVTLVSQASVRELAKEGNHLGELDARRFRMTLEVDGTMPFEEETWSGRRVAVGDAVLRLHGQVPRCRVTNFSPHTGLKDWETLTQIARFRPLMSNGRGIPFGVYAQVETPGTAEIGAPVAVIDPVASS